MDGRKRLTPLCVGLLHPQCMFATLHADKKLLQERQREDVDVLNMDGDSTQEQSTGCMGVCPSGDGLHTEHVGTTMRQSKEKKPCARAMSLWPGRVAVWQTGKLAKAPDLAMTGPGAALRGGYGGSY